MSKDRDDQIHTIVERIREVCRLQRVVMSRLSRALQVMYDVQGIQEKVMGLESVSRDSSRTEDLVRDIDLSLAVLQWMHGPGRGVPACSARSPAVLQAFEESLSREEAEDFEIVDCEDETEFPVYGGHGTAQGSDPVPFPRAVARFVANDNEEDPES